MAKFQVNGQVLGNLERINNTASRLAAQEGFTIQYIPLEQIKRNEKNFYRINEIEDLAESILFNGLQHNLVVRKLEDDTYELISGERRLSALTLLVKQGHDKFKLAPCKVQVVDEVDAEIALIQANAQTRDRSPAEQLKEVQRLTVLYKLKKQRGEKVPGRIREVIAETVGLKPTQVGNYEAINKNLIPELKGEIEQGTLTIKEAVMLSKLPAQEQKIEAESRVHSQASAPITTPPQPSPEALLSKLGRKVSTIEKTLDELLTLLDEYQPLDENYASLGSAWNIETLNDTTRLIYTHDSDSGHHQGRIEITINSL